MANISSNLQTITALENENNHMNNLISANQRKIKELEERYHQVNNLINDLNNVANRRSEDVSNEINKARGNASDSFSGIVAGDAISLDLYYALEKGAGSDDNVSNAIRELRRECERITNEIQRLKNEINNYRNRINNNNTTISNNKAAVARECRNSYSQANSEYARAKAAYDKNPTPQNKRKMKNAYNKKVAAEQQYNKYRNWG